MTLASVENVNTERDPSALAFGAASIVAGLVLMFTAGIAAIREGYA